MRRLVKFIVVLVLLLFIVGCDLFDDPTASQSMKDKQKAWQDAQKWSPY